MQVEGTREKSWEKWPNSPLGGITNIDENTKYVRRRRGYAMQEARSGEVLEWRLFPGNVIFICVGLGITINLFTGTAIYGYAALGIRMCISPGTAILNYVGREISKDPSGEANHPWDNGKLRPGGSQPPAGSAHKQDCTHAGVLPG